MDHYGLINQFRNSSSDTYFINSLAGTRFTLWILVLIYESLLITFTCNLLSYKHIYTRSEEEEQSWTILPPTSSVFVEHISWLIPSPPASALTHQHLPPPTWLTRLSYQLVCHDRSDLTTNPGRGFEKGVCLLPSALLLVDESFDNSIWRLHFCYVFPSSFETSYLACIQPCAWSNQQQAILILCSKCFKRTAQHIALVHSTDNGT
jgi:hypothetical protein